MLAPADAQDERYGMSIHSTRRSFLLGALAGGAWLASTPVRGWAAPGRSLTQIKALTFDMQGTVFDFYDPLVKTTRLIGHKRGLPETWGITLPGEWSGAAHDIIVDISAGRRPWIANTQVYREALTPLLAKRGVSERLASTDRDELLAQWSQMLPWPDAVAGITRLRHR